MLYVLFVHADITSLLTLIPNHLWKKIHVCEHTVSAHLLYVVVLNKFGFAQFGSQK